MSITDELRKYAHDCCARIDDDIHTIADRIDAEHESACAEAYGNGVMSVPIALDESAWVRLPKDADGVPIRVGDVMESKGSDFLFDEASFEVRAMRYGEGGWEVYDRLGDRYAPSLLRHHHAPTVEDVLREFALAVCKDDALTIRKGVVEDFAKRLTLAKEDA